MKKLFLMAAAAATFFTACDRNNENPAPEGQTTISVSLAMPGSHTRAVEAPGAQNSIADLTDGYIYILDGDQIVYREPLALTDLSVSDEQIVGENKANGGTENMLFPFTSKVYVLANIPDNILDPSTFLTMADLAAATTTITATNTDWTVPAMGNVKGEAMGLTSTTSGKATASVVIAPLFTRVELHSVKGGDWLESFDIKGVYVDNYYTQYTMTGELVSASHNDNGQDDTIGTKLASGWFGDEATGTWTTGGANLTAGGSNVWAYNIAAGNIPRVIVEVENVSVFPASVDPSVPDTTPAGSTVDTSMKFVTVKKFSDINTGLTIPTFDRGKIYQIKNLVFNRQAMAEPNAADVDITAEVEVQDWILIDTHPELD